MKKLRKVLDSITSYRLILYALSLLTLSALTLSALDILTYSTFKTLLLSLSLISTTCFIASQAFSRLYKVSPNHESSIITALILFLILGAPTKSSDWLGVGFASLTAIASKYVVTWRAAHIFNPAAFGVLIVSILGIGNGAWWIADRALFIPVFIIGLLVLLKIKKFQLFFAFLIPALLLLFINDSSELSLSSMLTTFLTLYPLIFLGSIMLTEPATMPDTKYKRLVFAVIVGLLFSSNLDFGFIASSPHFALLTGNLFAFLVTVRSSAYLKLIKKTQLTPTTYSFEFEPSRPIEHTAGQYMELTMPKVKLDSRGNRRTFTIASSPNSELLKFGVKFYENGSHFKNTLNQLKPGEIIIGNHVAGDFTLPVQPSRALVFIAGGVGITPFISMIEFLSQQKHQQPADLYYFVSDESEIAFKDSLRAAKDIGIKVHLRIGKGKRLTEEEIKSHSNSHFYLSGPPGLVDAYRAQLKKMRVGHIHVDSFTGY